MAGREDYMINLKPAISRLQIGGNNTCFAVNWCCFASVTI